MGIAVVWDRFESLIFEQVERRRHTIRTKYWTAELERPENLRGLQCHCPMKVPFHFVHSEGIREGADIVLDYGSNVENAERPHMPVELLARVAPSIARGSVVYMKADLLPQFVDNVLPTVRQPFVLVTAESDWSPTGEFGYLLDHPLVG